MPAICIHPERGGFNYLILLRIILIGTALATLDGMVFINSPCTTYLANQEKESTMKNHAFAGLIASTALAVAATFSYSANLTPVPVLIAANTAVDDTTITNDIKTALANDRQIPSPSVDVDTKQGVVTLTGAVANAEERARAGQLAASVNGVVNVRNYLQLKSSSADDVK